MEIVIGKRTAFFCNLKVLLIVLVVYGHLIETKIWNCEFLMWQYRLIYAVHMPLFAFVSGVFLKGRTACIAQLKKAFLYYMIFQSLYIVVIRLLQDKTASFEEPYWHLWYLLSLSCWAVICLILEILEKYLQSSWIKVILIISSIVFACFAGNVEDIDRTFSLSRTIVFLPYVLMGRYFPLDAENKKFRILGVLAGAVSVGLLVRLAPVIPVTFFYQADSYMARGVEHGEILRLLTYVIGAGLGFLILTFVPQRRLPLSRIGVNTLWIYILHAPVVLYLREVEFWEKEFQYVALAIAVSVVLLLYKGFQWREKLYRIV